MTNPGFKRLWKAPRRAWYGCTLLDYTPKSRYVLAQSRARYLRRPDAYPIDQQQLHGELGTMESFRFIQSPAVRDRITVDLVERLAAELRQPRPPRVIFLTTPDDYVEDCIRRGYQAALDARSASKHFADHSTDALAYAMTGADLVRHLPRQQMADLGTWDWQQLTEELTADELAMDAAQAKRARLAMDAAQAKRARRAARQRRLARKGAIESVLPPGLWRRVDGALMYECKSCGESDEWPAEIGDFDINNQANMCGGSPRCCP